MIFTTFPEPILSPTTAKKDALSPASLELAEYAENCEEKICGQIPEPARIWPHFCRLRRSKRASLYRAVVAFVELNRIIITQ